MGNGSRHARRVDPRKRVGRVATVTVVWVCGLAVGFYCLLSIAVRYGCGSTNKGLACTGSGSAVGTLLVVAVIAVVTGVTSVALNRSPRLMLIIAFVGLVALAACLAGARALLDTA